MAYDPPVPTYDDVRKHAEESLDEFHKDRSIPTPIEEIVEFEFEKVRYRFSLAHELAHHWIHDDLYQAVEINSVADWRKVLEEIEDQYFFFEYQANSFAGLVLVPPEALKA